MDIEQLKKQYEGEWLAIVVQGENDPGPSEGVLVYHSPDRDEVWRKIAEDKRRIYVAYAGPLVEEGHGVAFRGA